MALFVILSATLNDMILSGVQAALFSRSGLAGAAIARQETRFAGYHLLSSCHALSVDGKYPVAVVSLPPCGVVPWGWR